MANGKVRRRPTTWATPDTLTEAMQGMKPQHQKCRVLRHALDIKPNSYRYSTSGAVVVTLICIRCGDYEKDVEYDATGGAILERRSARYSGDYVLKGVGRIGSNVQGLLFEEVVQQGLRAEMKTHKGKRKDAPE